MISGLNPPAHYDNLPSVYFIPAKRQIGMENLTNTGGLITSTFTGAELVHVLDTLKDPEDNREFKKEKYSRFEKFMRDLLEDESFKISIPNSRKTINVELGGKDLPYTDLGTGIHELFLMVLMVTLVENSVICIEEPEIHLHPTMQKKLIQYLVDNTSNQYFISTHSAHILDTSDAAVFHLSENDSGGVSVDYVFNDSKRSSICSDLGYKASDILQANVVIWVEGPSDRIYLNHWIFQKDPELREGIEYSIMFYGGGLYTFLTGEDITEEDRSVNDLISIIRINRNSVLVMDSDKADAGAELANHKVRLSQEFSSNEMNGFMWITQGREIENYIPADKLEEAIITVHPRLNKPDDFASHYSDRMTWIGRKGETKSKIDKVSVAHEVCKRPSAIKELDLPDRIDELIAFIKKAND